MRDFLENLLRNIVDKPEAVAVVQNGEALEVSVDPSDMGKVIGKQGKIIRALRDLVRVLAVKHNTRVNVVLEEQ